MKILFTADVHVHDWPAHSTYDAVGVPSRLAAYGLLAQDIVAVARQQKVAAIMVAGDVLQKHSPKPMVANAVRGFFETLAADRWTVVVIPGNHDLDQKSGRFDPVHSGLRALMPEAGNVLYYDEDGRLELRDPWKKSADAVSAYIRPWLHKDTDYASFPEADIFLGHGMVQGSRDPFGYRFTSGYDAEELAKRFRLSVVGDIHEAQIIRGQTAPGTVLIPGQPIQVNHSSGELAGVWVYDTGKDSLEHFPSTGFPHAAEYHRFLTVEEAPAAPAGPNAHYRTQMKKGSATKPKRGVAAVATVAKADVLALALAELSKLKPAHPKIGETILREAYNDHCTAVQPSVVVPTGLAIGKVVVENFYSVLRFEVDFSQLAGDVLVVGDNGSGKSTLPEAVYWCVTGQNTKGTPVGEISNNQSGLPAFVSVDIRDDVNSVVYTIARSRDPNRLLETYANGSKTTKASTAETQEWIYKLLGFQSHKDILALLYFSTAQTSVFSEYTPAEQNQFLTRLTDSDRYEALKTAITEQAEKFGREYEALQQRLAFQTELLADKESRRARLAAVAAAPPPDADDYSAALAGAAERYGQQFADPAAALAYLDALDARLRDRLDPGAKEDAADQRSVAAGLSAQLSVHRTTLTRANARAAEIKAKLATAAGKECPECHQTLQDSGVHDRLIAALREVGNEIRATTPLVADLQSRLDEAGALLDAIGQRHAAHVGAELALRESEGHRLALQPRAVAPPADHSATLAVFDSDIAALREQSEALRAEVAENAPYAETLRLLVQKLFVRNSALSSKLVHGVFEAMVDKINELVGDPKLLKATASVGKNLDISVSFGGERPVNISGMSAGQRRLVDVLVMLALNSLFEQRYNVEDGMLGVAFYDEIITYLDAKYLDIAFSALSQTRARTRVMITHDPDLMSYYNRILRVSKSGGYTEYEWINT
jgi:hypothetical protein